MHIGELNMHKVFIDGAAGTTGLRIHERLNSREDLTVITLPEDKRKDPQAICEALNAADIAFLCLPDAAAREAVAMVENPETVILDTSTAHRTLPDWAYGFPELSSEHRAAISRGKRIAVPGCHASGYIALVRPLVDALLLRKDVVPACFSLTGYSGGGKKMIAQYEDDNRSPLFSAPRQYGLTQGHKHLPEMVKESGVSAPPVFCPVVGDFYSGMEVTVTVRREDLTPDASLEAIRAVYAEKYTGPIVQSVEGADEEGFLSASALSGVDRMEISAFGTDERILLVARYDNLGKGASGAAIQCMNLSLGVEETTGLSL